MKSGLHNDKTHRKVGFARCANTVAGLAISGSRVALKRGHPTTDSFTCNQLAHRTVSAAHQVGRNGPVAHKPLFRVTGVPRSFPVVVLLERTNKLTYLNRGGVLSTA